MSSKPIVTRDRGEARTIISLIFGVGTRFRQHVPSNRLGGSKAIRHEILGTLVPTFFLIKMLGFRGASGFAAALTISCAFTLDGQHQC